MASINYRLAPSAIWPTQIQDCKAAIRWLKAHAHQYGYDPTRIAVIGVSVGGHLAALLCTTSGSKTFDVGENLDSSSDVTCAINICGAVADFVLFAECRDGIGFGGNFSFLGGSLKDHMELARSASPTSYMHADEPPMLVVHGTSDRLVPYNQAELLVEAMDKAGAPYYFHTVVGGGHNPYFGLNLNPRRNGFDVGGGGIGLFEDPTVEPLIKAFLRHYLLDRRKDLFTGGDVTTSAEHKPLPPK
jgi:acetyl esterase/lipase